MDAGLVSTSQNCHPHAAVSRALEFGGQLRDLSVCSRPHISENKESYAMCYQRLIRESFPAHFGSNGLHDRRSHFLWFGRCGTLGGSCSRPLAAGGIHLVAVTTTSILLEVVVRVFYSVIGCRRETRPKCRMAAQAQGGVV